MAAPLLRRRRCGVTDGARARAVVADRTGSASDAGAIAVSITAVTAAATAAVAAATMTATAAAGFRLRGTVSGDQDQT
jgi:hypothetical protein